MVDRLRIAAISAIVAWVAVAGADAIFARLPEQGARLETLAYEPAAEGVGVDGRRASGPAEAPEGPQSLAPVASSRAATPTSALQREAAPSKP